MKKGITFGAFDLFHAGHVLMMEEAKSVCDYLIVCLQTDPSLDRSEKNSPVQSILERQISLLRQHGINEIFVVTGYQREKHTLKDIEYIFNPRSCRCSDCRHRRTSLCLEGNE